MKKSRPLHCKNFRSIIGQVIKKLKNGDSRLAVSNYPLKYACLNGFSIPDIHERLLSDHSMPSSNKSVEAEYFEEITLIEQLMMDASIPINLSDWQKGTKIESTEEMYRSLNRRAFAIQLWDWYAIPWRHKDNKIHIIWSPHDVMGTPIIHSYSVDSFLTNLSSVLENQAEKQSKIWKQLGFWKNFGIIVFIVIAILLLVKLS